MSNDIFYLMEKQRQHKIQGICTGYRETQRLIKQTKEQWIMEHWTEVEEHQGKGDLVYTRN